MTLAHGPKSADSERGEDRPRVGLDAAVAAPAAVAALGAVADGGAKTNVERSWTMEEKSRCCSFAVKSTSNGEICSWSTYHTRAATQSTAHTARSDACVTGVQCAARANEQQTARSIPGAKRCR